MGDDSERNEISLQKEFEFCRDVIGKLENGEQSTKELQGQLKQCEEKLKMLTREVSARSLFSNNENYEELPTGSLDYLLLPYYLATVAQNLITEPEERIASLDRAKIYLHDFLQRLKSYSIIGFDLPWIGDDNDSTGNKDETQKAKQKIDPSKQRESKLRRFQQEKEMIELVKSLESELRANVGDDSLMRELIINRLRLSAMRAMNELEQIDEERPLAEHMLKIRSGQAGDLPKRKPREPAQMPFIIARDEAQKKVFGLGYPSIPTMTVNEWFDDMMKNGRFGAISQGPSESEHAAGDIDDETQEERERARLQQWDEYKDYHRRGWGNMHNKG